MRELTKLTADELRVRFDVLRPKLNVPARLVLAEISRRLERLEKCETQFVEHTKAVGAFLTEMHATMIDPLAEGTIPVKEMCELLLAQARKDRESERESLGRLEKCEAALRKARTLLISEGDPEEDREMIAEIDELLGDAARAVLEGK